MGMYGDIKYLEDKIKKAEDFVKKMLGHTEQKPRRPLPKGTVGSRQFDPEASFNFVLEVGNVWVGGCRSISGLEWSVETESFHQGGENRHKVNLVGKASFSPLKLKRGFFAKGSPFFEWMKSMLSPNRSFKRETISVIVLADDGQTEVGRFNLYNAFMSKYSGPSLDAGSSQIAFEEIEIVYDYFDYVPASKGSGK